jgi:type 1 glutamine amidotransferase
MIASFWKSTLARCFLIALGMGAFGPLSSVFAAEQASAAAVAPPVKRVLLLTGEDYPGHKWRETTPVLRTQLEQDTRLGIHVVEDLKFLRSPELHTFAAIVMHFKNYDPAVPGPEGQENLARFVRQGGGAVLVHFACGAFQEWPDFVQLAGRVWDPKLRGHDPHGSFRVDIVDSQHPITQGFPAFDVTDELYTCLAGETPVTMLATAVSKVDQKAYPIAFVLPYGQGRVFHSPLGHDARAFSTPAVGELFRRGTAWAAGLPPTPTP